jgi:hypothetical protein
LKWILQFNILSFVKSDDKLSTVYKTIKFDYNQEEFVTICKIKGYEKLNLYNMSIYYQASACRIFMKKLNFDRHMGNVSFNNLLDYMPFNEFKSLCESNENLFLVFIYYMNDYEKLEYILSKNNTNFLIFKYLLLKNHTQLFINYLPDNFSNIEYNILWHYSLLTNNTIALSLVYKYYTPKKVHLNIFKSYNSKIYNKYIYKLLNELNYLELHILET